MKLRDKKIIAYTEDKMRYIQTAKEWIEIAQGFRHLGMHENWVTCMESARCSHELALYSIRSLNIWL